MSNQIRISWHSRVAPIALVGFSSIVILILLAVIADFVLKREVGHEDLDSLVELAKALIWPMVILTFVSVFNNQISSFLTKLSRMIFKFGDSEITLEAKAIAEASYNLGAAIATSSVAAEKDVPPSPLLLKELEPAKTAAASRRPAGDSLLTRLSGGRILWVDDNPENNRYLIKAFESLGVDVGVALSTEEAISKLEKKRFDVLITDMGRPPDPRAGYTLLEQLKRHGIAIPTIIYAGSNREDHRKMARAAGAIESTNDPQRVFELATDTIVRRLNH